MLPFWEYVASSELLRLSSPRFQNFGHFQRAHPPFVFYFTATFISFSYCLIRARSPVGATVSVPYILLFCFFAGRCSYLMALYRDLSYFSRDFAVYFRRALALLDGAISGPVVLLSRFHRLLTVKLSGLPICVSRLSVARGCLGVCRLSNLPDRGRFRGYFPESLYGVPSRSAVVVHLAWNFAAGSFHGKKGIM